MQPPPSDFQYVDSPAAFEALLDVLRRSPIVGLDTEFIPEGTFESRLCLIQLATAEGIWLVDPIPLKDTSPLWKVLTEPDREIVALAAAAEIQFCLRGAGRAPARLLDVQLAAGLVGYGYPLSGIRLLQSVLHKRVKGGEAFTDWSRRPLAARQLGYAADDVRHLLEIRSRLLADADRRGRREWFELECRRMVDRVVAAEHREGWQRVSGSSSLEPRELAVLRELWLWRKEVARSTDRGERSVLPDHLMVGIARRQPATVEELGALRGMDRISLRKAGPKVLEAVQRGVKTPETDCPQVERHVDPPQVRVLVQLLGAVVSTIASETHVDAVLLATSADLHDLVRWRLGRSEGKPSVLQGWREQVVGRTLMEVLEGTRRVRVADLNRRHPLAFDNGKPATPEAPEAGGP